MPSQRLFSFKKLYQKITGSGDKNKNRLESVTETQSMNSRTLDFTEDAVFDQSCYEETSMRSENSTLAKIQREDILYELTSTGRDSEEFEKVRIRDLKKSNEELYEMNLEFNKKAKLDQQTIAALKLNIANERKEAADARYELLKKHQNDLKKKEKEILHKEIEMIKQFSSTKLSENSISPIQTDALKTSDCLQKVQSSPFIYSTPISLNKQKKDVTSFAVSIPRRHLSPVPESQVLVTPIAPIVTSAKIESLLRDLITCAFQLRDSSKKSSKYVKDWLNNVQPQIAPPNMRADFREMLDDLNNLPKEGIEKILEKTSKMLRTSSDTTLEMTRNLEELKKQEMEKEDASI